MIIFGIIGITLGVACIVAGVLGLIFKYSDDDKYIKMKGGYNLRNDFVDHVELKDHSSLYPSSLKEMEVFTENDHLRFKELKG